MSSGILQCMTLETQTLGPQQVDRNTFRTKATRRPKAGSLSPFADTTWNEGHAQEDTNIIYHTRASISPHHVLSPYCDSIFFIEPSFHILSTNGANHRHNRYLRLWRCVNLTEQRSWHLTPSHAEHTLQGPFLALTLRSHRGGYMGHTSPCQYKTDEL